MTERMDAWLIDAMERDERERRERRAEIERPRAAAPPPRDRRCQDCGCGMWPDEPVCPTCGWHG